jgi:hypothetical protein
LGKKYFEKLRKRRRTRRFPASLPAWHLQCRQRLTDFFDFRANLRPL